MRKLNLLQVLVIILAFILAACTANGNTAGNATATAGAVATTASAVLPNTGATATPATAPAATTVPTATTAPTATPAATSAAVAATAVATTAPSVAQAENAYRVSKVIGFDVKDPQGNELGKVSDLIVSRTSGLIDYVVLSSGGILGAGAKDTPVPWSGLKLTTPSNGDQYFVLNTTKDALDKAPAVNLDNLPTIATGKWDVDIRSYWANLVPTLPQTGAATGAAAAPLILKDDVNKLTVLSAAGQDLGHIDDMILDPTKGQVLYAVLAAGDALNVGNKLIPVPFRDIRWTTTDNGKTTTPVVNVSEAQLQKAPSFDSWDKFPNLTVSNWDAALVSYWGVR